METIYRRCPLFHGGEEWRKLSVWTSSFTPWKVLYPTVKSATKDYQAPIIIHLNLPGTELVSTSPPQQSSGKLDVSTLLSTCEACIILVIQMYPQGTGRGSVTATLWWWGSVRGWVGCHGALVWQLIYCETFYNVVHQLHFLTSEHTWNHAH